jgi:prevent-host-death family protein
MAPKSSESPGLTATEFKATCLRVMDDVHRTRRPVTISRRGKPLVKIVPVDEKRHRPLFGYMKGTMEIVGDIVSPDPEAWNSER